jgi:hypothetical protein
MAAADVRAIANAPHRVYFSMVDTAGGPVTGQTTVATFYSADDAALATAGTAATEVGGGLYYKDLTAAQFTGNSINFQATHGSAVTLTKVIIPEPALDSGEVDIATSTSVTLRSAADNTADVFTGAEIEIVSGTGAGQIRTITAYSASLIATMDRAFATTPAANDTYIIHPRHGVRYSALTDPYAETNVKQINDSAAAAILLQDLYEGGAVAGSISDASPSDTSFIGDSGLTATEDFYNNHFLVITSGALTGQARAIADYSAAREITLASALPAVPANGSTFVIIGSSA